MKKKTNPGGFRGCHPAVRVCALLLLAGALLGQVVLPCGAAGQTDMKENDESEQKQDKKYIKWIDFSVTRDALNDTLDADVASASSDAHLNWIDLLACLALRYGGDFSRYVRKDLDELKKVLTNQRIEDAVSDAKLFSYYREAYEAVLGGMVGNYTEVRVAEDGTQTVSARYGLRCFSPVAQGFGYSHYDDFGAARSYGYKRPHLGHDLMGTIGTPVVAIESGYVEHLGWNQYGGWRVGIRSLDGKRYWYYAHLRRGHPYADLTEGQYVNAGDVIGYLGMTGYSAKEDVNNIDTPHLHIGLQVIFDASQIDGWNQIWIDLYELTSFLEQKRVPTRVVSSTGASKKSERASCLYAVYPEMPDE